MTDFRSVSIADVYKGGRLAGTLVREAHSITFSYDESYLSGGAPIAFHAPLDMGSWVATGGAVPSYFAGLLPEGIRLDALVRSVHTSKDDMFSLLLAIGSDAVGDVVILPHGEAPTKAVGQAVRSETTLPSEARCR